MFKKGFKTWCERASISTRRQLGLQSFDPIDLYKVAAIVEADIKYPKDVPGLDKKFLKILTEEDPDSWSAITIKIKQKIVIILNSAHTKARQMSSLGHELSHLIIGHPASKTGISADGLLITGFDRLQEDEAGWLSGCLLLPHDACQYIKKTKMDQSSAQRHYGISADMYTYRMNASGVNRLWTPKASSIKAK